MAPRLRTHSPASPDSPAARRCLGASLAPGRPGVGHVSLMLLPAYNPTCSLPPLQIAVVPFRFGLRAFSSQNSEVFPEWLHTRSRRSPTAADCTRPVWSVARSSDRRSAEGLSSAGVCCRLHPDNIVGWPRLSLGTAVGMNGSETGVVCVPLRNSDATMCTTSCVRDLGRAGVKGWDSGTTSFSASNR